MAGILWGSDPFAELVDKATSELLPAGQEDISLNLEICDQVRAKQVQPKHAMQVIKRRLGHKNPNVAMLALGLTDVCIKNGGDHFLTEVASREFMDNLVSILRDPAGVNVDLKSKSLGLIQNWSQIAEARPASASSSMGYITQTYRSLQEAGFEFPPRDPAAVVSAALVETMTAPEWIDGDVCMRCRTAFTTFNRKHHCRNCGNVFDAQCSGHTMALPWFGVGQDVRVCDGCYAKRAPPKKSAISSTSSGSTSLARSRSDAAQITPSGRGGAGSHHRSATLGSKSGQPRSAGSGQRRQREEDDLALAIRLSLESSGSSASGATSSGYVPSSPPTSRATRQPDGRMLEGTDADDDPDLAAAIAASLRDFAPPAPSAPTDFSPADAGSLTPRSRQVHQTGTASRLPLPPSLELANPDIDALLSFSQGIRVQEAQAAQTGMFSASQPGIEQQQVYAAYDKATAARPRLARNLEEGNRRLAVLTSMHDKLGEAVHLYNRILDSQLSRPAASYAPQHNGHAYAYAAQQHPQHAQQTQHWGFHHHSSQERHAEPSSAAGYSAVPTPSSSLYPNLSQQPQAHAYIDPSQHAMSHGMQGLQPWQQPQQHGQHPDAQHRAPQQYQAPYSQHHPVDAKEVASPSAPPHQAHGAPQPQSQSYASPMPSFAAPQSATPQGAKRQEPAHYANQTFSPEPNHAQHASYAETFTHHPQFDPQQQQQTISSPHQQQYEAPWHSLQNLPSVSSLPTVDSARGEAVHSPSGWAQSAAGPQSALTVSSAPLALNESGLTPVSIEDATGKDLTSRQVPPRQEPVLGTTPQPDGQLPGFARSRDDVQSVENAPPIVSSAAPVPSTPYSGQSRPAAFPHASAPETDFEAVSENAFNGWRDIPIAPTAPPVDKPRLPTAPTAHVDQEPWRSPAHRQMEPSLIEF
ncbi:ubiquitin binding protein [Ceraceosorus bombacis]|uniref:Vacuolar protein sorting-associated protein 27 n=1 Tax=Ceraceosorus bombacis TaxID=401625 RepID=A0A0P1BA39_9BASI|nr:ubiquitin binding protein [Ceraceosorus bombacis]